MRSGSADWRKSGAQRSWKQNQEADKKKFEALLQEIPNVFLFVDQGTQDGMKRIAFRPNPSYAPKTYEQRVLHRIWRPYCCEPWRKSASRDFPPPWSNRWILAYGVIGRLDKGGSINITRVRVSPGILENGFVQDRHEGSHGSFQDD